MLLKRGWPPMSHIWGEKRGVLMHKRYSAGHGAAGQNRARVPLISMWLTALLFITLTYLYCHVAFGDLPHVEANRGNHVFTELTRLLQNKRKKVGEKTGENAHSKKKPKTKTQCWERTGIKTAWCFTSMCLSLLTFKTQIAFLIYVWNFTKQNSLSRIVCQWLWLWPKSHVKSTDNVKAFCPSFFAMDKRKLNWLN